jgi:hypothetical protein
MIRRRRWPISKVWVLAPLVFPLVAQAALPQSATHSANATVVLTELSNLVYPPMARIAQIAGDVQVEVRVRPDGSVESAVALGGPPLLLRAVVENAKSSKFECRGCTEAAPYLLTYTFQIPARKPAPCCCTRGQPPVDGPKLVYAEGHVILTAGQLCVCPDSCGPPDKYRSAKGFYLWRCGVHREM